MRLWFLVFILCCFFFQPCLAVGEDSRVVAILEFEAVNDKAAQDNKGRIVSEIFITAAVNSGLTVVERHMLRKVLDEMEFGKTAFSGTDAMKIGEMLGAGAVLTGSVSQFADVVRIDARLINVSDGGILLADGIQTESSLLNLGEDVERLMSKMVAKLLPGSVSSISKATGRLYVDVTPQGATIRIMNIGPRFIQGMELAPGRYHLRVERQGYERYEDNDVILDSGEEKRLSVTLRQTLYDPETDAASYFNVIGVEVDDVLNIRARPRQMSDKVGEIPNDGICILAMADPSKDVFYAGNRWRRIKYGSYTGWVNIRYLESTSSCP